MNPLNRILIAAFVVATIMVGCHWAPGDDNPPEIGTTHYPNNGSYGPDASRDRGDAGVEASVDSGVDAMPDVQTPNCLTACANLQCGSISNECGGSLTCTPCRVNEECVDNFCREKPPVCVPETNLMFCNRNNIECGGHTGMDNCNQVREVANCRDCAAGVCLNHTCCQPETDPELCARNNKMCGVAIDLIDNCGQLRLPVNCGQCVDPQVCNNNQCEEPVIEPEPVPE